MSIAKAKAHLKTLKLILEQAFEDGFIAGVASNPMPKPATESELAAILAAALKGSQGWRADARRVLGLATLLKCKDCDSLFEGGGKQKLRCKECTESRRT